MKKNKRQPDIFRWVATGVLFLFSAVVFAVLISDFIYADSASIKLLAKSSDFHKSFLLTIYTSFITTFFAILIAIPSAYALSRYRFPGIVLIDTLVDLLIVLPVLIIGVSLLVFFKLGGEMANSTIWPLRYIGMAIAHCADFFVYNKAGVVLAQFFCSAPFAIRMIKTSFDEISVRTEDVARTLGCSHGQAFFHVTLPLARNGILAGTVIAWMLAFGVFGAVTMVAGAVRGRTEVLPTSIFLEVSIGRIELALVISIVMMLTAGTILTALRVFAGRSLFRTETDR